MAAGGCHQWHWDEPTATYVCSKSWCGKVTKLGINLETDFFVHGTSIDNGLDICLDGFCRPSTWETPNAIAGSPGVYCLQLKPRVPGRLEFPDVAEAWKHTRSEGFNKGAMLICRLTCSP